MGIPTSAWQRKVAWELLDAIEARQTSRMRYAIIAWQAQETGWRAPANNNLWNTFVTGKDGKRGLAVYRSREACVADVARLLTTPKFDKWAGYDKVVAAARANDPVGFIEALAKSRWDAAHYGAPKINRVLDVYKDIVKDLPGHWF